MSQRDELMSDFLAEEEEIVNESENTEAEEADDEGEGSSSSQADGVGGEDGSEVEASSTVLTELASKDELSLEDIRKLPGSDKYTDAQLEEMWEKAVNATSTKPSARSFKVFKEDAELEALTGLTAEELLSTLKFGYNANGKEQRKTFEELVRTAQMGHYQESRLARVLADRNTSYEKATTLEQKNAEYEAERKMWGYAMSQHVQGNDAPLQQLIEAFRKVESAPPEMPQAQQQQTDYEREMAGQKVYYEVVVPTAYKLAQSYGANPQEVVKAIEQYVNNEPAEFMNEERFAAILQQDIPFLLEQNGYTRSNAATAPKQETEVEKLKKELATLKAEKQNNVVRSTKLRKSPPSGNGTVPSAGETMPEIKTRQQMKDYLRA